MLLLAAGDRCPAREIASGLVRASRRYGPMISSARGSAAVARARATLALKRARRLFVRTNFAGCVSLLSIIEQELGREVADEDASRGRRAFRLLAEVNLWLGVCQWSAGDPQAAASSFLRSAQLPSSPISDEGIFPPALVAAYRRALRRSRQEVSCTIRPPLTADALLVDGKGPALRGDAVQVPVGTHYLVLGACDARRPACRALRARIGGSGLRAMRLDAQPMGCTIQIPAKVEAGMAVRCVSRAEASDPRFVASVLREAQARLAVSVTLPQTKGRVSLRLMRRGHREFTRQLHLTLDRGNPLKVAVARAMRLLVAVDRPAAGSLASVGGADAEAPRRGALIGGRPWYRRWWIWAAVGAVALGVTTTVALSARSSTVRVVFGP